MNLSEISATQAVDEMTSVTDIIPIKASLIPFVYESAVSENECKDRNTTTNCAHVSLNKYADLKLVLADGQIDVCKSVLCANSVVFETMLTQNFMEKGACEIRLHDDQYSQMLALMTVIHPPLRADAVTGTWLNDVAYFSLTAYHTGMK